ncbi:hypothetical protein [Clostridium gasigenes]|uniref:hypothetical protein n=1 Tax=Clostridium gasigenes TaxID=94869 RepID=UPI003C2CDC15
MKIKLKNNYNIILNHKRIRMLMKKHGLITTVRRANPYAKMLRGNHENKTLPNIFKSITNRYHLFILQ